MKKACVFLLALCLTTLGFCQASLAFNGAIYEIFPGSFADGDGDGAGDLSGITKKAEYIASLGVGAVWLTPISPSPSYHRYDVVDYCAIDPKLGTMDDFDALVSTLQGKDIALLLDLVINHTSSEHPWFLSAVNSIGIEPCGAAVCTHESLCRQHNPYCDYYMFTREPGNQLHTVNGAKGWYYLGEFGYHMPDLNLDSEAVRGEIVDILRFWMERGVCGFRLDATTHYYAGNTEQNVEFMAWLTQAAKAIDPDTYLVGEAWTDGVTIAKLYESGIDSFFAFPFAGPDGSLVSTIRDQNGAKLARAYASWGEQITGVDVPFFTNHDMARSAGMLMNNEPKMRLAAAVYLLRPGHPIIYYGEEIAMSGSGRDENKRLPMVWGDGQMVCDEPMDADQAQRQTEGVAQQEADENSLLQYYRRVLSARSSYPEINTEKAVALGLGQKAVYALRYGDVVVMSNFSKKELCITWEAQIDTFHALGEATLAGNEIVLPALETVIIREK